MDKFLKELETELKKKNLYKTEIDEILAYYEEIISDRYEQGEPMNRIIESYDIKLISRMAFPQALQKRVPETKKEVSKNIGGLLLFLFSIPILIPLGILYLAFIIVVMALIVSGIVVGITGIFGFVVLIYQMVESGASVGTSLAVAGIYLFVISLTMVVMYYVTYAFGFILKGSVKLISRLIGGGNKYEKTY